MSINFTVGLADRRRISERNKYLCFFNALRCTGDFGVFLAASHAKLWKVAAPKVYLAVFHMSFSAYNRRTAHDMLSTPVRNLCGALTAAAAFTLSGAASAGFYDSSFDPPFFNGTAVFEIDDSCLHFNGEHTANSSGCSPVDMRASPVPIVHLDDSLGHTATLNFSGFMNDFDDMEVVAVIGKTFAGIRTDGIGGFLAAGPNASFFPGYFFLQFDYTPTFSDDDFRSDSLRTLSVDEGSLISVKNFVRIWNCRENEFDTELCTLKDTSRTSTFTLIAAVPEPGTLALILGGLGAGWWTRRRKTAA